MKNPPCAVSRPDDAKLFFEVVVTPKLPREVEEGLLHGANLDPKKLHYANEELEYAIYCRAAAGSEEEARNYLIEWFADAGVSGGLTICRLGSPVMVPTRAECRVTKDMECGDVLIKAKYFAFVKGDEAARKSIIEFLEATFMKRRWQFWK